MTCAKQLVTATLVAKDGRRFVGTNACAKPQAVCPLAGMATGQGYELCASVCEQQGHAEVQALRAAGSAAVGSTVYLQGHDYGCNSCIEALRAAGVAGLVLGPPPDTRPQFEDATWAHYQGLKARGWSHPEEGDPNSREALFWREANGQYGVRQIEAAWRGWLMREAVAGTPKIVNRTFPNGMTVADLKALIRDWPETDGNDEPCEVWIETGDNLSNMVCRVTPLNYRIGEDGKPWADILLKPWSPE